MVIQYSHRGFPGDIMGLKGLNTTIMIITFSEPALIHSLLKKTTKTILILSYHLLHRLTIYCIHVQKRPVEDSDWRKNVEAMSGMEGRKKMFDAAKGPAQ